VFLHVMLETSRKLFCFCNWKPSRPMPALSEWAECWRSLVKSQTLWGSLLFLF